MPNGRCKMHGGKSLVGSAVPSFKHGRYSQYLPTNLLQRFQEAMADPALLEQAEEIGLVAARIKDLLANVRDGDTPQLWLQARQTYRDYHTALTRTSAAQATGDQAAADHWGQVANGHMETLGRLLNDGATDHERWAEIDRLTHSKRRLVESERKRMVEASEVVARAQVVTLIDALIQAVHANVHEPHQRSAIEGEFARLLGTKGLVASGSGG